MVRSGRKGLIKGLAAATACLLLAAVAALSVPAPVAAVTFADVGPADWFAEAADVLSDEGIVQAGPDGTFRPYEAVTRAEFAVLLSRALGLTPAGGHPFTDFPVGAWYESEVAGLFAVGLITGVTPTDFRPDDRVSRQQAVSFVMRALVYRLQIQPMGDFDLELTPAEVESWLQRFPDRARVAETHRHSVANAYRLQIVSGKANGFFDPLGDVTRAQCIGMLYAALYKTPVPLVEPSPPAPAWSTYPTASTGSRGDHVKWLEQRLSDLTYRPGPIDGVFDERTRLAVIAFQKWEGLSRDGVVGASTWVRLAGATRPTASRGGSGVWIEVVLAKQVFLYVENGIVTRTLPTSTGRSFTYRSAPYTVQRKPIADGPRYRALYLNPGYVLAIHGYPSVPVYPASDGCIRLPKWDMDDLRAMDATAPLIPDGTKVYIY
ncbi:MAG: S-layer homology domain-containing protein [Thermoleophilia bacterium]|nr:S-layer homology domain-containing protein [Thermoleophilia bacterium]